MYHQRLGDIKSSPLTLSPRRCPRGMDANPTAAWSRSIGEGGWIYTNALPKIQQPPSLLSVLMAKMNVRSSSRALKESILITVACSLMLIYVADWVLGLPTSLLLPEHTSCSDTTLCMEGRISLGCATAEMHTADSESNTEWQARCQSGCHVLIKASVLKMLSSPKGRQENNQKRNREQMGEMKTRSWVQWWMTNSATQEPEAGGLRVQAPRQCSETPISNSFIHSLKQQFIAAAMKKQVARQQIQIWPYLITKGVNINVMQMV